MHICVQASTVHCRLAGTARVQTLYLRSIPINELQVTITRPTSLQYYTKALLTQFKVLIKCCHSRITVALGTLGIAGKEEGKWEEQKSSVYLRFILIVHLLAGKAINDTTPPASENYETAVHTFPHRAIERSTG